MEAPKELLAIAVKGLGTPEKAQQLAEVVWKDAYARGFAEAREKLSRYCRHERGCTYRPDTPALRALHPKGHEFKARPCSCGLAEALSPNPASGDKGEVGT